MSDQNFTTAYTRVRNRHSNRTWQNLSAREIADEIYKEIHLLDLQVSAADEKTVTQPMRVAAE
jgi:hypothetical protein